MIKTSKVVIGPYKVTDKVWPRVILIIPANRKGTTLQVNKFNLMSYDGLATVMAHPAQFLEISGGLWTPDEVDIGAITLEYEDPENKQEMQLGATEILRGSYPTG